MGPRRSALFFLLLTALVVAGAIGLLVLLDPRTLPWVGDRLAAGWAALGGAAAGAWSWVTSLGR